MPKSKKSPCASCKSRSTRKTSAARTAKAAKLDKMGKTDGLAEPAKSNKLEKTGGSAKAGKPVRRPKKSEVPPERLCEFCDAKCCRYFALPIDKPSTFEEFDYVRWYLLHERASVFVEDGDWFLLVHTPCKELGPDNRCQIYETRPQICREYSTTRCEYDDLFVFEQYFETPEQVEEYAVATLGPRPGTTSPAVKSAKPAKPAKSAAKKEAKSAKPAKSAAKKTVKKETKTTKTTQGRASTKKSTRRGA